MVPVTLSTAMAQLSIKILGKDAMQCPSDHLEIAESSQIAKGIREVD
jgi:hypothetical protein